MARKGETSASPYGRRRAGNEAERAVALAHGRGLSPCRPPAWLRRRSGGARRRREFASPSECRERSGRPDPGAGGSPGALPGRRKAGRSGEGEPAAAGTGASGREPPPAFLERAFRTRFVCARREGGRRDAVRALRWRQVHRWAGPRRAAPAPLQGSGRRASRAV